MTFFTLTFIYIIIHSCLLNYTHLVWLDALTMLINNPINIFLMNQNIVLYYFSFIKYLWISKIWLVTTGLKFCKTEKKT